MGALCLTEIMIIEWRQILDEVWDEVDKPYSGVFGSCPQCLIQYYNEMPLVEAIEILYLTCKSEQYILTPKCDILYSFVPLLKQYHLIY